MKLGIKKSFNQLTNNMIYDFILNANDSDRIFIRVHWFFFLEILLDMLKIVFYPLCYQHKRFHVYLFVCINTKVSLYQTFHITKVEFPYIQKLET
jgi:hypothetical protein